MVGLRTEGECQTTVELSKRHHGLVSRNRIVASRAALPHLTRADARFDRDGGAIAQGKIIALGSLLVVKRPKLVLFLCWPFSQASAQQHSLTFQEPIPLQKLASHIADVKQVSVCHSSSLLCTVVSALNQCEIPVS